MPVNGSIPSDPSEWEISHVDQALEIPLAAVGGMEGYKSNLAYLAFDHIQKLEKTWRGPGRTTSGGLDPADARRIEAGYVAVPEAEDCVERRVSAVCGVEADFKIAPLKPEGTADAKGNPQPSEAQATAAKQYAADLGAWWRQKAYWEQQKQALRLGCAAPQACIRIFINPSALRDGITGDGRATKIVPSMPFAEALSVVEAVAEWPAGCGVYTHPDTRRKVGIWRGKDADGNDFAEVWFIRDGKTVLRRVFNAQARDERGRFQRRQDQPELEFEWGGLIPIIPLEVRPLLTGPVRGLQQALDSTATGLMRLLQSHCYTQRDEINTEEAGTWETYPPASSAHMRTKVVDGVTYYKHDGHRELGMGVTNSLVGIEHTVEITEDGKERLGLTTPNVIYHEPSDPANVIKGADYWTYRVRVACKQGHITDGGSTAEASGDAYEQRRAIFAADAEEVGNNGVAPQTSGVIAAVATIARWIESRNDPPFVDEWTVDTSVVINTGPVSSDKVRTDNESVAAGTLSLPTALQHRGTRDVPAELERITESNTVALKKQRQELAKEFIAQGVDPVEAYIEAGWTPERAKVLGRTDGGITEQ